MTHPIEKFMKAENVSRETLEKLEIYHALLVKWQRAINLVSPKTVAEAWERHFVDSAQIVSHIPSGVRRIVDLGSGGGFPALVVAIMRPDIEVHLVESDERKAQFLRNVSRETQCGAVIHNARVEDVLPTLDPDLITARAFASLKDILDYCAPMFHVKHCAVPMLLMKGESYLAEIEEAQKSYRFSYEAASSQTNSNAVILSLKDIVSHDENA